MTTDPRKEIWNAAFEMRYDSLFNEVVAERLVSRWQSVDDFSRVVIALTVSGSAMTGWALWQQAGYRTLWTVLAGVGAVLSIIHLALDVPARLTFWTDVRKSFAALRNQTETLQLRMRLDSNFDIGDSSVELLRLREEIGQVDQQVKPDLLAPRWLKKRWQAELDQQLGLKREKNNDVSLG